MVDQYYAGDHGGTLYRVTENPLQIFYLEWAHSRWTQGYNLFRVISPVGGEQNIEPVTEGFAREMVATRLGAAVSQMLVPPATTTDSAFAVGDQN